MAAGEFDARALLQVAPDDYVAERTRLVKQARAEHDRALVGLYQALKRPNLSLWAVLAAGGDAAAVARIVTATTELAEIQAGGSDANGLATATQHRRKALEGLVDAAVTSLARWEPGAEARRAEIRGIIDQLSRHPDVVEAWIDGTLRDLPDDAWGFGAFADLQVTTAPSSGGRREAEGPTRAERAEKARSAREETATAKRDLAAAERRVDAARAVLRNAEKEMRLAESDHAAADRRHKETLARLEGTV